MAVLPAARRRPAARVLGTAPARVAAAAVAAAVALLVALGATAAWATASLSPTRVEVAQAVSFTVTASAGALEVVTEVTATVPGGFIYGGCGGPDDWTCSASTSDSGATVTWNRQGLGTADPALSMTFTTPTEPGDHPVTLTDRTSTGTTSSNTVVVTVALPEPATDEPTEEPSEEPSSEAPTDEPDGRTPPAAEPFRPPSGEGQEPISLGEDRGDAPVSTVVMTDEPAPAPRARSLMQTAAIPVAALLLLSALSFLGAWFLRPPDDAEPPATGDD